MKEEIEELSSSATANFTIILKDHQVSSFLITKDQISSCVTIIPEETQNPSENINRRKLNPET